MKFCVVQSFDTLIWAMIFLEAYAHDDGNARHTIEEVDMYSTLRQRQRQRQQNQPSCTSDAIIYTDKLYYEEGEEIHVSFLQCEAAENDWIGVYSSYEDADNLGEDGGDGKLWVYACGSQQCLGQTVDSGNIEFDNGYQDERGPGYWPLKPGRYKVHLIRDIWPYVSYAESNIFEVTCNYDATISTDKVSYDEGDEINVSFVQCDAEPNDWIGVYHSGANNNNLGEEGGDGELWVYTSGTQQRLGREVFSGDVEFDDGYSDERGSDYWPLNPGRYKAHLIRDVWPYVSYAESNSFRVTCNDDAIINTDKNSYQVGEEIRLDFRQCDAAINDWIGVYQWNANKNNLGAEGGDGELWVYACGSQQCTGQEVYSGNVEFDDGYQDERGPGFWPLGPGRYKVHLIRDAWPYISYAETNEFEVIGQTNCIGEGACTGSPDLVFSGTNICIGRNACSVTDGAAQLHSDSCHGRNACNEMWDMTSHSIGSGSCQGSFACYDLRGTDVGSNSCQGDNACAGLSLKTIGNNACNCDNCCDCNNLPSSIGDNSCNSLGECCG